MTQQQVPVALGDVQDGMYTRSESLEMWKRVAEYLRERADRVIETHISYVALCGDRVYKLKKPVRYDFVDFSDAALRRAACEKEIFLNRRLAPDVYLGVMPVTLAPDGGLDLAGQGEEVEWLVAMRRLSEERNLEALIRAKAVRSSEVTLLAANLTRFYATARRVSLSPGELVARTRRHIEDNQTELLKPIHGLDPQLLARITGRQLQFLTLCSEVIERRVAAGYIVDGHGDLRPEHICLEANPIIFDCLEFDDSLREIDIADDLGFFAMECERIGAAWIGERILASYQGASGDSLPEDLLSFYRSYRATVRAKVALLSVEQLLSDGVASRKRAEVNTYLALADRVLGEVSNPLALIVRGVTGSGKSTLAAPLARRLGAVYLQTDRIRRQLFGRSAQPLRFGEGHYSEQGRDQVYHKLLMEAQQALSAGRSVVVDGCFLARHELHAAAADLSSNGAKVMVLHCVCPENIARQRIAARVHDPASLSEATIEHYEVQKRLEESSPDDLLTILLDTGAGTPNEVLERSVQSLRQGLTKIRTLATYNERWTQEPSAEPCPMQG